MADVKISHCVECPNHEIINDRDPNDWFCDDDVAVICKLVKNKKQNIDSKYISDRSAYKCITVACRPHHIKKETKIPSWCPLNSQEQDITTVEYIHNLEKTVDTAIEWLATISSHDNTGHIDLALRLQELSGRKDLDVQALATKAKQEREILALVDCSPIERAIEENAYSYSDYDKVFSWFPPVKK